MQGQKPIQKSTGTANKELAKEYEAKLSNELWLQSRLGIKPRYLWEEAVVRYLNETEHNKSRESDIIHLKWLHKHLSGKYLDDINRTEVDRITAIRKKEGVSNATVNRCIGLVSRISHRASLDWEWIDKPVKVRKLPEPKMRIRFLKPEEATTLISELPSHLAAMVKFSLATGLRKSNVTELVWSQVDLVRKTAWVHADQAKNGKPIAVPLNTDALNVLREQLFKHQRYVFTYQGKPVKKVNGKAWRAALERAGITNFRWHDLRHTWASWHVQKGTPIAVLKELGGWSDIKMVMKYAHLSSDHLAGYVDNVSINRETVEVDLVTNQLR